MCAFVCLYNVLCVFAIYVLCVYVIERKKVKKVMCVHA